MHRRIAAGLVLSLCMLGAGFLLGRATGAGVNPLAPTAAEGVEAGLTRILATADMRERVPALTAFLEQRDAGDAPALKPAIDALRSNLDPATTVALMDWWARFEPQRAIEYGGSRLGDYSAIAMAAAMRRWAREDPEAARAAIDGYRHYAWHPKAVLALVQGWGASGDRGVWKYVEELPRGVQRQQALALLAHQMLLHEGPEALQRFAEALPDATQRRFKLQIFRAVAAALPMQHPELATAWAERHFDGPFGDHLLTKVATSWSYLDGEATASWLASLPPSDAQREAMRTGFGYWQLREPEAAQRWLRAQPPTPALEPAWALLALNVGERDPAEGLAIAETLGTEPLRRDVTIALGRLWLRSDPDQASAWVAASALPEDVKQEIRRQGPRIGAGKVPAR